ncbi:transposase [Bathymodiolus japonicus methanotrophic gill symbiont]|uniref:transposase n=1 Tax=Bathymodiolus japonicus methanotrophic gill symbiont TaxID=113269 RepID=UPI001C8DE687|nr:transposase [Bathymodiolus japonicus methanotrophic gill symbiont]
MAFYFVSTFANAQTPKKQRPYGYRGLKIFTSLKLRFQDFQRMTQAAQMLIAIAEHFSTAPILTVTDSWFGNNGLWKPVYKTIGSRFNILSRLRCNNVLYDRPEKRKPKQRGRNKKYGQRLGSATDMAKTVQQKARSYTVNLYGKQREVRAYSRVVMLKTRRAMLPHEIPGLLSP